MSKTLFFLVCSAVVALGIGGVWGCDDDDDDNGGSPASSSNNQGVGNEETMSYSTWTDSSSGLTWQYPTAVNWMAWQEAMDYCSNLTLDGGGWHLPTISELRSLIRDCPETETGGACGVTDSCLEMYECWGDSDVCNGCKDGGCNWDPALFSENESSCEPAYWSSSPYSIKVYGKEDLDPNGPSAWGVGFGGGRITFDYKDDVGSRGKLKVRCVRPGP